MSYDEAIAYSQRWMEIIRKSEISETEGKQIIEESKNNFAEYFNKGWLDYRKSVTEAGDWAATEWTGSGAIFSDVLGRQYIDCLGGYGLLDLGWSHPEVVNTVRGAARAYAHAKPGVDRSLARCPGAFVGRHHARGYQI